MLFFFNMHVLRKKGIDIVITVEKDQSYHGMFVHDCKIWRDVARQGIQNALNWSIM